MITVLLLLLLFTLQSFHKSKFPMTNNLQLCRILWTGLLQELYDFKLNKCHGYSVPLLRAITLIITVIVRNEIYQDNQEYHIKSMLRRVHV